MAEVKSITPKEVFKLHEKGEGPFIIDVRTKQEFEDLRATIVSEHMPLDEFDPDAIEMDASENIYLICRSGRRSFDAASQCVAAGYENVYNIEGGTLEWEAQDLPVTSGPEKKP